MNHCSPGWAGFKVADGAPLPFRTKYPKAADLESSSVSTQRGALSLGGSREPNTVACVRQGAAFHSTASSLVVCTFSFGQTVQVVRS